ncbi:MAG: YicC family protein [Lachnospiraceae bacterium]|nr:YicC family protein [Lachnospiraceae bacterium]
MVKSMTGFGRYEAEESNRKITVEIKSVNHRYLDMNVKLPKKLSFFESSVRNLMKEYMQRGKVDIFITYEDYNETNFSLKYNETLAGEYLKYLKRMAEQFELPNDMTVSKLSRYPDVLVMEEQDTDEEELWTLLEKALRGAGQEFVSTREGEGERLCRDLDGKLAQMLIYVDEIEAHAPEVLQDYRERLAAKVQEILADTQMDEGRIATEVTIYADRICVDEETVRLRSHIEAMRQVLKAGDGIGRKLDFIAQEMNREANTILSKAGDLATSDLGINLKTDIEKVREQIQNIE